MSKKYGVFISYSHEDGELISPIVDLVSSMRKDLVFLDKRELKHGKLWEPQILGALDQAEIVIVFWCKHSAASEYVRKEYETAIEKGKDVLPILLDATKIAEKLAAYQWIDFRNLYFHFKMDKLPRLRNWRLDDLVLDDIGRRYSEDINRNSDKIATEICIRLNEKFPQISAE